MTPEEKQQIETQIQNNFSELQQNLENLKNDVKTESDEAKKQEKEMEIKKLEDELSEIKTLIDTLSSLQEADLQSLKTRLESTKKAYQEFSGEMSDLQDQIRESADKQNEIISTPTTYELLKDQGTYNRLLNIISTNPDDFKDLKDDNGKKLETPEAKLEYIFRKIRESIVLFMENKLGQSENVKKVINNTIAPAFEWSLMELLRNKGNESNVGMLEGVDEISWDSLLNLFEGINGFATKYGGYFENFSQWMNAIDYLSVHHGVFNNPSKSEVLSNPLKFKEYMNNSKFIGNDFSPYVPISDNIFKVDESQTFNFGISLQEKQEVISQIGDIQVVNNPRTTSLIVGMLNKPASFLKATSGLQNTANHLLDVADSINPIAGLFGVDILGEITKSPENRSVLYKILDFVCKLIGITGGLEGIVKKWRMDRMNLTDEKNRNISQIFEKYQESAGEKINLNIVDEDSCKTALDDFKVTELDKESSTKGDFLRDSMAANMDVSLLSPAVIQQTLGESYQSYLKKQTFTENGSTTETYVVDESKFTDETKKQLAQKHLENMKTHLQEYNKNDLSDFYTNIKSTEDLAVCITAALFVNKDDVIEGVKAKVFLPENYGSFQSDGTVNNPSESGDSSSGADNGSGREKLDSSVDSSDKQKVSEQWIYDKAVEYGVTDKRQIAYILSTVKGECNYKNQPEIGRGEGKPYGAIDQSTGQAYYGRGFIQLTWKGNYEKFTQIIRDSGKEFKDNNGNVIGGSDVDLVNNPDIILQSNELAAFILIYGMKNGTFTGRKLDDFINETKTDFDNARSIVNGMSSSPALYADNAQSYLSQMEGDTDSSLA